MKPIDKQINYLKDYKETEWQIAHLDLDILIADKKITVISQFQCTKQNKNTKSLELNGKNINLLGIEVNGKKLPKKKYNLATNKITILDLKLSKYKIKIKNEVNYTINKNNLGFCYSDSIIYTQCAPEGFREITYFLDKPEIKTSISCKITASKKKFPHLLANGSLVKKGIKKDQHWALWQDSVPKPCYLFSLVAGNFHCQETIYKNKQKNNIKINFFVSPKYKNFCDFALNSVKLAMQFEEEVFKLQYDLPSYQIVAIENFIKKFSKNRSLNIYDINYILADQKITTPEEYIAIDKRVALSYFYNWIGNKISIQNWFNLALKEGLNTFISHTYSNHYFNKDIERITATKKYKKLHFRESNYSILLESYLEIDNFSNIGIRAAEIFRMLKIIVGKSTFFDSFQKFIKKYPKKSSHYRFIFRLYSIC